MNKNEENLMFPVAEFLLKAEELIEVYSNELDSSVTPSLNLYRDPINRVIRTLEAFLYDEELSMLDDFFAGQFTPESIGNCKGKPYGEIKNFSKGPTIKNILKDSEFGV